MRVPSIELPTVELMDIKYKKYGEEVLYHKVTINNVNYCIVEFVEGGFKGDFDLVLEIDAVEFTQDDVVVSNFDQYFEDWKKPTIEEWEAFYLEHNL